ncbi:MAG TPA: sulfatase-like hydrolase/transferase [Sphaerochaeta sp.]|nr:sulfatase-like hydrolase/transferase [Sphaerochaeta sp.]
MSRPNIIFYFSDQQRVDTCGCYGQELDITPTLDAMASEGVRFDLAFSPQPVCGPCRSIFQTGMYATDTGCFRNSIALPQGIETLGSLMEGAGYETAYIGKWHLASSGELEKKPSQDYQQEPIPLHLRGGYTGFWRASDVLEFTSDGYGGYVYDEQMQKREFSGYRADCITDFALEFFDTYDGKKPFFMTISQIEPHHQNNANHYQGPVGSKERYADYTLPEDLRALGGGDADEEYPDYLGACRSIDDNLGRLIARLKEEGLYEDTIIIFTSDHGSHFRTRNRDDNFNGYDDYKRTAHDAALRVPLVIRGGSYRGGGVVPALVSTESITKTILAMGGVTAGERMIGEDLASLVDGVPADRPNEIFAQISESRVGRAIRTDRYLYAVSDPKRGGGAVAQSDTYVDDYLYDLEKDPHQLVNEVCNPLYKDDKMELRSRLQGWIKRAERLDVVIGDGR